MNIYERFHPAAVIASELAYRGRGTTMDLRTPSALHPDPGEEVIAMWGFRDCLAPMGQIVRPPLAVLCEFIAANEAGLFAGQPEWLLAVWLEDKERRWALDLVRISPDTDVDAPVVIERRRQLPARAGRGGRVFSPRPF